MNKLAIVVVVGAIAAGLWVSGILDSTTSLLEQEIECEPGKILINGLCYREPTSPITEHEIVEEETTEQESEGQFEIPSFGTPFPSCGEGKEMFSVSHIPIENLENIVPLGNLNPSAHTFPTNHLYFQLKGFEGHDSGSDSPAVSPGDIYITRISSSEYTMDGREIKDYSFAFTVCKEVNGYFIHFTSLSDRILQEFGQPTSCEEYETGGIIYRNCQKDFSRSPVYVNAGDPLGTVGGSSDLGLADLRTPELVYANPDRWYEDPLHRVCPLDYFESSVGTQLKSLLGSGIEKRTIEPICGEVAQDVPGTAQGVWFVKGTTNTFPEDPHLALAHDNTDPSDGVFSVGNSIPGLESDSYYFAPENSGLVNRDFKDVKPSDIYCYDSLSKRFGVEVSARIILQLTSENELRIEKQDSNCGDGPWSFTSSHLDFER